MWDHRFWSGQTRHSFPVRILSHTKRQRCDTTILCSDQTRSSDRSKVVLLLWIIYVISVLLLLCFRARLFIDALWSPAGKGLTSWLSFVMSSCEVVTVQLVSWLRCDAWLYRFLIFILFLTMVKLSKLRHSQNDKNVKPSFCAMVKLDIR